MEQFNDTVIAAGSTYLLGVSVTGHDNINLANQSAGGNDTVDGNIGNDTLDDGFGDDTINGSAGTDTAIYSGFGGGITVNLNVTMSQNTGAADTDELSFVEDIIGGDFNDRFTGRTAETVIDAGSGSDFVFGLGGDGRRRRRQPHWRHRQRPAEGRHGPRCDPWRGRQ